jgi:hypothetical protein
MFVSFGENNDVNREKVLLEKPEKVEKSSSF